MKYLLLIICWCFLVVVGKAQSSNFTGSGNWTTEMNWSNGLPKSNTNVTTTLGSHIFVNAVAECNDLSLFLSSMTINSEGSLTINGVYSATTTGTNLNNGTLILRGNLKPAIGNKVLTINGGITSVSGLTFPTFSID